MTITSCLNGGRCIAALKIPFIVSAWLFPFAIPFPALADFSKIEVAMLSPDEVRGEFETDRIHRLTEYIHRRFRIARSTVELIVNEAVRYGAKEGVRPEFILAIIAVESSFRERVVSHADARGLMQVIPRWHPEKIQQIGGAKALFDPSKNIATGTRIFIEYLALSRGDLRRALLRYNGSLANPASRYPERVLEAYAEFRRVTLS